MVGLDDELPVVHTLRHGQEVAGPDLVVMKPPNGLVRVLLPTVTDVAVGPNVLAQKIYEDITQTQALLNQKVFNFRISKS